MLYSSHDGANARVVNVFFGELVERDFAVEQSDGQDERHTVGTGDRFLGIGSAQRTEVKIAFDAFDVVSREAMLLAQRQQPFDGAVRR